MAASETWWKKDETVYGDWQELTTDEGLKYYYNTQTQETTWEKPAEMMSDSERAVKSNWVWYPTEDMDFLPALNRGMDGGDLVLELQDGREVRVDPKTELEPLMQSSLQRAVPDLTLLDNMSTPLILHCLRRRFEKSKIYTAIGNIIISINPYTRIEGLYERRTILKYRSLLEEHRKHEPHVFVPAHNAFATLSFENGLNQSIIISGESGAGKTEAAKQCLSYIGAVAGSLSNVEQKVFQANPILEAFGNAKTIRNNNSSRFGKYVDMAFDKNLQIAGAVTTNYLLEKIRVVAQAQNERNYHIFYFLTSGADRSLKESLGLSKAADYSLCAMGGCTTIAGMSDPKEFADVQEAWDILGFSQDEVSSVYQIVASILHLGNVTFSEKKIRGRDPTAEIDDNYPLKWAASLLEVDEDYLAQAIITQKVVDSRKELSPQGAMDQRDNFCKFVYSKMFDWLVIKINESMVPGVKIHKKIGILDIFGFEIFDLNSLEQLCINYCNERLQNLFNRTVFEKEQRIYKEENIGGVHVEHVDNGPILKLIEQTRPLGLLAALDEELRTPGGNIARYKQNIDGTSSRSKFYRRGKTDMSFILTHYAGDVLYTVEEFMEKNKDSLSADLAELASKCGNGLMKTLFGRAGSMSSRKRKATLCKQFKTNLDKLMKILDLTQPHYIRCIKPNDSKEALYFVAKSCLEQLTYSGVFEAVKIRKSGYPYRLRHDEFVKRYKCILEEGNQRCGAGRKGCQDIVKFLKLNPETIKTGKTMMLYRASEHSLMELKQSVIQEKKKMASTLREILATNIPALPEPDLFYQRIGQVVRSCNRYNIHSSDAEAVRELLEKFIMERMDPGTRELLEQALETRDLNMLIEVCEIIELNDYQTTKCQLAIKLRDRILRIYEESRAAMDSLEVKHMRAVMEAAEACGYETDEIATFKWLFSCGPEDSEAFMKEHLKLIYENVRANIEGSFLRAMAIEIKLKDKFFDNPQFAQTFEFTNFPGLKDADDWAGESWALFKGNLQDTMMVFTDGKIHTSLNTLEGPDAKAMKKLACENLLNIQYFCSDKPAPGGSNAEEFGLKILHFGFTTEPLRDEIYCQIVKQIRMNEGPYSVGQCWKLLNLCLYTFRPSVKIENYLTMFIRNHAGELRDSTLKNLQTTLYNRDSLLPNAPTMNDMHDIAQGARARYNFLEEPPQAPTWGDLLEPFDSPGAYDAPLAGMSAAPPKQATLALRNTARSRLASMQTPPKPPVFNPGAAAAKKEEPKLPPAQPASLKKVSTKKPKKVVPPVPPQVAAKQEPEQPEDYVWVAHIDVDSADLYYFNIESESTTWDRPREPIKPLWVARLDGENGQFYYEDMVNGETSWDSPEEFCDAAETWTAHMDADSSDYYYENLETGEVTWNQPDELKPSSAPEWVRHWDKKTNRFFYENLSSGHVTWDEPAGYQA